ncbi:3'-5' exonuclease [Sulfitobacter geojensis]|uniref:3'-5' exonuclease n=1 Tax=Sulfitobacter geojensis TaxID=1342299 RepID=UPI0004699CE6|nr:3'-5' exonuclease [Sulfitobacter geojensis]KHA53114.1 Exonuclease family protein [Sulfitobacter geojensis]NYI28230.1 DNA polymerase III epsilon subunit-like protein [Sulfitobacter geojensis]
MTIPTAPEILQELILAKPRQTCEAPKDARGIYGLFDHLGEFRYIGSTSSISQTFYERIHRRHRAGSETHSHYFARMYNTGRMWVDRNDPDTASEMKIVRRMRQAFIAQHCRAVWVPLPDHAPIADLEAQVIAMAPAEMTAWNNRGMDAYDEPEGLVDALIERLSLSPYEREALYRQRDRFYGKNISVAASHSSRALRKRGLPPLPNGPFRFFALDVETANHDRGSICQIGVACVRHDDSIETWASLVDPQSPHWTFSDLHGITNEMVRGAPKIGAVIDTLNEILSGRAVYQHSGFDRSAVRAACDKLGRSEPSWDWLDSVGVARRAWPELKGNGGHGLASLKAHLGLRFEHHDAGEDARAAAEIVLLAERGILGATKDFDVLDDEDVGLSSPPSPMRNTSSLETVPPSPVNAPVASYPAVNSYETEQMIFVPVAADGSAFGPELARNGRYTVGPKGGEVKFDDFGEALKALRNMDVPRWRRPNAVGNWGIVSGLKWKCLQKM